MAENIAPNQVCVDKTDCKREEVEENESRQIAQEEICAQCGFKCIEGCV